MGAQHERFTISQVGLWIRDGKILILEDSDRPDVWLLPGGRIHIAENPEVGFLRELEEELMLLDVEVGPVVDADAWYTPRSATPVSGIARMIFSDQEGIELSEEHTQYRWVSEEELSSVNFMWPCGERMCRKGFDYMRHVHKNV